MISQHVKPYLLLSGTWDIILLKGGTMNTRARTTKPAPRSRSHHRNGDVRQQQTETNRKLISLVESWLNEDSKRDPHEVRIEWEEFKSALEADRLSDRKLFP
jgi:hypothetical protein